MKHRCARKVCCKKARHGLEGDGGSDGWLTVKLLQQDHRLLSSDVSLLRSLGSGFGSSQKARHLCQDTGWPSRKAIIDRIKAKWMICTRRPRKGSVFQSVRGRMAHSAWFEGGLPIPRTEARVSGGAGRIYLCRFQIYVDE